jgi:pyruvyltransferase
LSAYLEKRAHLAAKLPYTHVDLYHWSPVDGRVNFGDRLADIVTRQMLSRRGHSLDDQVEKQARLLAIGSVLQYSYNGDHVWGTGWNGKLPSEMFTAKHLNVHAVRGPLTAEFLRQRGIHVPDVFGDPALLIPHIFNDRFQVRPETEYVFVPNLHDLTLVDGQENIVSPLWGWNRAIENILKAKLVLASSLHGLIIAEAFGIPARYVRLSQSEDLFKYKDYYFGSGRTESEFGFASSIEEGKEMGGAQPIRYNPSPLIEAFPFELWK